MPNYNRYSKAELVRAVIAFEGHDYPFDTRRKAIDFALRFVGMQSSPVTEQAFTAIIGAIHDKISVSKPSIPADLDAETDADLVTLAEALDLAQWDWLARVRGFDHAFAFYERNGTVPTTTQIRDMALNAMNYVRSVRGLADVT